MKELKRGEESVLGEHFEDTGSFKKTIDFKRFPKVFGQWRNIFKSWGQWYFWLIDTSSDCQDLNIIDEVSDGYWLNVIDLDIEWHSLWQTHLNFAGTPYSDLFNLYKQLFYNIGGSVIRGHNIVICTRSNCMGSVAVDTGPKAASSHNHSSGSLVSVCTSMCGRCTQLGLCYGAIVLLRARELPYICLPGFIQWYVLHGAQLHCMLWHTECTIVCHRCARRALQIVFYQCALHCCYVVHIGPLAIHTSSW